MPVEEVVAPIESDTQMAPGSTTVLKQTTHQQLLYALVEVTLTQRQRSRAEENGQAACGAETHADCFGLAIVGEGGKDLPSVAHH